MKLIRFERIDSDAANDQLPDRIKPTINVLSTATTLHVRDLARDLVLVTILINHFFPLPLLFFA